MTGALICSDSRPPAFAPPHQSTQQTQISINRHQKRHGAVIIFCSISSGAGVAWEEEVLRDSEAAWSRIKLMPRALVGAQWQAAVCVPQPNRRVACGHRVHSAGPAARAAGAGGAVELPHADARGRRARHGAGLPRAHACIAASQGPQACVQAGTVMVVSTAASILIEDIATHVGSWCQTSGAPDPGRWLQLYGACGARCADAQHSHSDAGPQLGGGIRGARRRVRVHGAVSDGRSAGAGPARARPPQQLCLPARHALPSGNDVIRAGVSMVNRGLSPRDIAQSTAV